MGKSFKRNNSDSYKYGSNKKPKAKKIRTNFSFESKGEDDQEDWRNTSTNLNIVKNLEDERTKPNRP
jgi:hypothetical protein